MPILVCGQSCLQAAFQTAERAGEPAAKIGCHAVGTAAQLNGPSGLNLRRQRQES